MIVKDHAQELALIAQDMGADVMRGLSGIVREDHRKETVHGLSRNGEGVMQKWEFRLMVVQCSLSVAEITWEWGDEIEGLDTIEDTVHERGRYGWEFFSVAPVSGYDGITAGMHLWFKRPIRDETAPDTTSVREAEA